MKKHRCPTCGTVTKWTPEALAALGTDFDQRIDKQFGLTLGSSRNRRVALGITPFAAGPGCPTGTKQKVDPAKSEFHGNRLRAMAEMRKTHTLEGISRRFGITRERVRQLLKKHGVPKPTFKCGPKRIVLPEKYVAMFGVKTDRDIAKLAKVSQAVVSRIRNELGIKAARWIKGNTYDANRVAKLYLSGHDGAKVAAIIGCSRPGVYAILRRLGIERRPKGCKRKVVA